MMYKRILTIQDISCVGQCSMTVAMPILSACGHETCILPTAMLSTHTGGFGKPAVLHFGDTLENFWQHWQSNGIVFDAILVGYLGSVSAIHTTIRIMDALLADDGVIIVDPVMADHGKLYSGFDITYVEAMKALCQKADVILPNITEASFLANVPYQNVMDKDYVKSLLEGLKHDCVILTGVGYEQDQTGAVLYHQGKETFYPQHRLDRNFHGTGDMFAACFTGALLGGKNMEKSIIFAEKFTELAIKNTIDHPAHWYGIKFEPLLFRINDLLN